MFRFSPLSSRLKLMDVYFDIASQEELYLVECNFILLQKHQFTDILWGGDRRLPLASRDMFSNIKPCRDAYLKLYDYV